MRTAAIAVITALLAGFSGCGNASRDDSDCGASIRFGEVVYVGRNDVNQHARAAEDLGPREVVDCDHATVVEDVLVTGVKGVDSAIAIRVVKGTWRGVYVAEGASKSSWPKVLAK